MDSAVLSPYPHHSWLGTWHTVGQAGARLCLTLREVAHCLIYASHHRARVRWIQRGRERHFVADAGTVRFVPADGERHTLVGDCDPGHRFHVLLIPRDHLLDIARAEGLEADPDWRHSLSTHDAVLEPCIRRVAATCAEDHGDDSARDEAARTLVLRLLEMNGAGRPDWHRDSSLFDERTVDHLAAYIDAHLRVTPSLGELAPLVGLSPSHFAQKFRRSTGLSLHRFVTHRRVAMALEMLRSRPVPLAIAALKLGFASPSHFTRVFSDLTGMTPTRYRRQFGRGSP